jgi:hypothetical protein
MPDLNIYIILLGHFENRSAINLYWWLLYVVLITEPHDLVHCYIWLYTKFYWSNENDTFLPWLILEAQPSVSVVIRTIALQIVDQPVGQPSLIVVSNIHVICREMADGRLLFLAQQKRHFLYLIRMNWWLLRSFQVVSCSQTIIYNFPFLLHLTSLWSVWVWLC